MYTGECDCEGVQLVSYTCRGRSKVKKKINYKIKKIKKKELQYNKESKIMYAIVKCNINEIR